MEISQLTRTIDHTLLNQTAEWSQIQELIDEAVEFSAASVCIPPCFVRESVEYSAGRIPVCTVIGFPNGYNKTSVKIYEAKQAILEGATEIDMVINLSYLKSGRIDDVFKEITAIREATAGNILKVIVETCFLSDSEKTKLCEVVLDSGADFIKTSTGFGSNGAKIEDIELFASIIKGRIGIKASGGIGSLEDAQRFLNAGASRLGTSRIIKALKNRKAGEY